MSLVHIKRAGVIFILVILFGGIFYHYIEGWKYLDAVYFTTVTVTTLGYGDFVPLTNIGKIFTIFFSISGIALGLYVISAVGKYFFTIELKKRGVGKYTKIKNNKKFDVEKMSIGEMIEFHPNKKEIYNGQIIEIGRDYIKINTLKKNKEIIKKNDQETIKIYSKKRV